MVKWEIEVQDSGITDIMRINILSILATSIDTHGSSEKYKIAKDVRTWLDETYGEYWRVTIGGAGTWASCGTYFESKFLRIKETALGWGIDIFKQAQR
ncbi:unnamed protein product [Rotaria sp. Silwood2]|nr:unnamed protein product [Rotaria sp. Silwood2]CAF2725003.1 unnamed protein product [Rotaria sp. Silwood2]CAF2903557.1 unnamed protein product [Rotaria sp. Silwood2]CAF3180382.1 unnamed protein product [Rotaria sp. Silwood2]CAF3897667.1 unnamed protein product [Rotaria sp. Silwood2]